MLRHIVTYVFTVGHNLHFVSYEVGARRVFSLAYAMNRNTAHVSCVVLL
jgi:hypothetical protein